jgi:hypothetical protein
LELGTPFLLGCFHLAVVALVIHSEKVEDAVQHQYADFIEARMAELGGLFGRALGRYRDLTEVSVSFRSWE